MLVSLFLYLLSLYSNLLFWTLTMPFFIDLMSLAYWFLLLLPIFAENGLFVSLFFDFNIQTILRISQWLTNDLYFAAFKDQVGKFAVLSTYFWGIIVQYFLRQLWCLVVILNIFFGHVTRVYTLFAETLVYTLFAETLVIFLLIFI